MSFCVFGAFSLVGVVLSLAAGASGDVVATLPLNQFPFIQAHDSATGYLAPHHLKDDIVFAWTKTQEGTIPQQLDCGARSLDWRPKKVNGSLVFHHGAVTVPHSMADALRGVIDWANANRAHGADALVIIDAWDCEGESGCNADMLRAFGEVGVPHVECSALWNMTVADALKAGRLEGGGAVLMHNGCPGPDGWTTYTDEYQCSGFLDTPEGERWRGEVKECIGHVPRAAAAAADDRGAAAAEFDASQFNWGRILSCAKTLSGILDSPAHYNCHRPLGLHHEHAFDRLESFGRNISALQPPARPDARLYSVLANWAEGIDDVVLGFLHASSLLDDEKRSGLNKQLTEWVLAGKYPHVSLMSVNNVCNGGQDLLAALRARL